MATRGPSRAKARPPARPQARSRRRGPDSADGQGADQQSAGRQSTGSTRTSIGTSWGRSIGNGRAQRWASTVPARSRLTGRMAVLILVLAVLTVSYASSLRAFLHQRSHISELKAQIAEQQQSVKALEREKRRWQDPAYVQMQARQRFGYVMPGETGLQVIDTDGEPMGSEVVQPQLEPGAVEWDPTWWQTTWQSVELAGQPPKKAEAAQTNKHELIRPPKGQQ